MFYPKFFTTIRNYNKSQFFTDATAGIIVGVVAIPLAIAFAIASGVSPEKGLFTAIIAGFLISFLGGSRVQIGGPTGAFVVIVAGIIQQYGFDGLLVATLMAGAILIVMGFAKLGTIIKFIPYPLIVGFTSGIALIIFSTQIKDFFGLTLTPVPSEFIGKWGAYFSSFHTINLYALLIGGGSLLLILIWNRFMKKVPGTLIALILATLAVQFFNLPVETIGSRFGAIPSSLPVPVIPNFNFEMLKNLVQPAFTIALLAGIESLLSAMVADGMVGGKHRSNTELIAQGIANIASPLFGGIPATGAIARTATNIKNGGRTPVAGMVHAVFLLLVVLFFGQWAVLIPLPCLAAVLILVSYNMSEWRSFKALLKSPREDVAVLLLTFFLTVLVDLTVAIEVGMILAVFLFMRRMAIASNISVLTEEFKEQEEISDPLSVQSREIPEGVEVYEINGPFFFGAAEKFKEAMLQVEKSPKVRIIRMRHVPVIDSTGLRLLREVFEDSAKNGTSMVISGINPQPLEALKQAGLYQKIGENNFCQNIDFSLKRAKELLGIKPTHLTERIRNGGIYYNLEADNILEAIKRAVELMPEIPKVSKKQIQAAVIAREELMPTAIGKGIAVPHSRNPIIQRTENEAVALIFLEKPLKADSPDGKPLHTLFLILSSDAKTHLELLSKISYLCRNPEFIELLEKRPDRNEILDFIEAHEDTWPHASDSL